MKRIVQYTLDWNMKSNKGSMALRFEGGGHPVVKEIDDPHEFIAVRSLFGLEPLYSDGITIRAGWEKI